jgi:hypothetical protein
MDHSTLLKHLHGKEESDDPRIGFLCNRWRAVHGLMQEKQHQLKNLQDQIHRVQGEELTARTQANTYADDVMALLEQAEQERALAAAQASTPQAPEEMS